MQTTTVYVYKRDVLIRHHGNIGKLRRTYKGKHTYIRSYAYYSVTIAFVESLFFHANVTKSQ